MFGIAIGTKSFDVNIEFSVQSHFKLLGLTENEKDTGLNSKLVGFYKVDGFLFTPVQYIGGRIPKRIIFVFSKYLNTNTNNIRTQIFGRIRIRIIFGPKFLDQYEYE